MRLIHSNILHFNYLNVVDALVFLLRQHQRCSLIRTPLPSLFPSWVTSVLTPGVKTCRGWGCYSLHLGMAGLAHRALPLSSSWRRRSGWMSPSTDIPRFVHGLLPDFCPIISFFEPRPEELTSFSTTLSAGFSAREGIPWRGWKRAPNAASWSVAGAASRTQLG